MATKGTAQDRWKRKDWFTVVAPDLFHNVEIGKIIATEAKTLPGKRVDTTVYDVTNDAKKAHMKLLLEITHLEGGRAHTKIKEFELVRAYVRSLVRRHVTKIEAAVAVEGRDGIRLRIKPLVVTASKCRSSQKGKIRRTMMKVVFELAKAKTFEEFLTDTIAEKIQKAIREEIKKIYPVRNVEIRRIQIINPPVSIGRPKPVEVVKTEETEPAPSAEEPAEEKPKKRRKAKPAEGEASGEAEEVKSEEDSEEVHEEEAEGTGDEAEDEAEEAADETEEAAEKEEKEEAG
jgi:small subunit ribosomal protein S3Ae